MFTFYEIKRKEQITQFLDTKIKAQEEDPDRKWITTWNHNLVRIKHFFRWLYNYKKIKDNDETPQTEDNWETPEFAKIKQKKTKRISPYAEAELWERDDILNIIKYVHNIKETRLHYLYFGIWMQEIMKLPY